MKGPRIALAAFVALGVAELVGYFVTSRRGPAFEDWAALAGPVAEERKAGELVVVAPPWAEPLARQALGDGVFPLRDVARPDVTRYRAALLISALGEASPELSGFREIGRREVGPFVIRRLENPSPAEVVFDFVDGLGPARADVRTTSPEARCLWNPKARVLAGGLGGHPTFPAARFECPGGPFFSVGPTVIAAGEEFRPRRCLFSHPPARGEVVTRYSGVPLGGVIRGHGGMYWIIERERQGAPVALAVRVDGEEIGRFEHRDGDGWAAFEMPLGAHAGKKSATVEFFVSSKNHAHRHFCFEADTR
ncbi:hypothetical protein [Polyangium spumosum]|uniref:Uncharacterized protein n=1 Tax=Polyangium spumosum TaxID=889282 RepID=A0A6N7PKP2_9BACT|nr:hypothetical protein [Polyangium spumosum]MRG90685.1 hypothetical protein [Polyangium spumosum]